MPQIKVSTAVIYYEIVGESGPWVTLINGHTRTSKDFKILSKKLATAGYRALSFDNRGSGQTKTQGPFSFADLTEDVTNLWRALNIEHTYLVGISMGGMISQHLAATQSHIVDKLVLVSTTPEARAVNAAAEYEWGTGQDSIKDKLGFYFTPQFMQKNKLLVEAMAKQIEKAINEGDFTLHAKQQREAMRDFSAVAKLKDIECPTLIIHGEDDQILSPREAERLAAGIHNSRLKILPGAGHLLIAERPQEVYGAILEFLD